MEFSDKLAPISHGPAFAAATLLVFIARVELHFHTASPSSFNHSIMAGLGGIMSDGGDPRLSVSAARPDTYIAPQNRLLHDPAVTFEEYHYWALKTRAEEEERAKREPATTGIKQILFPPKENIVNHDADSGSTSPDDEKSEKRNDSVTDANLAQKDQRMSVTDAEWTNASRAFRTATWAACFYLITTDILGPFGIG